MPQQHATGIFGFFFLILTSLKKQPGVREKCSQQAADQRRTATMKSCLILPLLVSWYTWALPSSTPNRLREERGSDEDRGESVGF